jgi:hypothetical protein
MWYCWTVTAVAAGGQTVGQNPAVPGSTLNCFRSQGPPPPPPPPPPQLFARWIEIPNGACQSGAGPNAINLAGFTTRDLYIRFDGGFRVLLMNSGFGSNSGITFSQGPIFQHRLGRDVFVPEPIPTEDDPNPAPRPACVEFDSYFSLGMLPPSQVQFIKPSSFDATAPHLELVWFATGGADAVQNSALFGDSQFYVRVARFTVPTITAVLIGSELEAGVVLNGAVSTSIAKVLVPQFPPSPCRADFNASGTVDTGDLTFFLGRFGSLAPAGSPEQRADFNSDGTVNTPDLVYFLGRFGQTCP